jgi:hypothetical protein
VVATVDQYRFAATHLESTPDDAARMLARVDRDGALAETAHDAVRATRRSFVRAASIAAVSGLGLAATPVGAAAAARRTRNDIAILRFDLVLEYLQAALYTEAERIGALKPETLDWARVVGAHERAHARAIKDLLGSKAVKSPAFDFRGVTEHEAAFVKTAVAFEDATAALLKWQAPRLDSRPVVAAVLTLHSVETRHAAWIRRIVGVQPASSAFDRPASQRQMTKLIASTRFVTSAPRTKRRRKPRFTG